MRLTRTPAWSLGTAGLCIAIALGSWFLLIEPERAAAADLREQTVAAQGTNTQLELQIEQLKLEFADRPAREAELAALRQALPDEAALARLSREVNGAGKDAGVVVSNIVSSAATTVVDPAAVTEVAPDEGEAPAGEDAGVEPTPAPSAPADDTGAAPAAGEVTAVAGAPAGSVLASVPVTVETTGSFYASNLFLRRLQADIDRALLVDGVVMTVLEPTPEPTDGEATTVVVEEGTVSTTITARVFVFVDAENATLTEPAAAETD